MSRVFQKQKHGPWWIDFKDAQGVRRRIKAGPTKRIAKEVLDGYVGKVARQQHLGIIEESAISFADFVDKRWLPRIRSTIRPGTLARWESIAEKLKTAFPGSLRSITAAEVERWRDRRLQHASPGTVGVELTVLKHILGRAAEWQFVASNRAAKVRRPTPPPGRTRFLSLDEISRLLEACENPDATSEFVRGGYLKALVLVALNAGMRRNEILSLTRSSIDWQNSMATLETTKNGEKRHVHLNETALDALRSLPSHLGDERLFPFPPATVSVAFERAAKRAGLHDFRLHDCRHTFASYQAMAGVQSRGLQSLLGHRDGRMTMRYSHLSDDYLRAAVHKVHLGANGAENGTYLAPAAGTEHGEVKNAR